MYYAICTMHYVLCIMYYVMHGTPFFIIGMKLKCKGCGRNCLKFLKGMDDYSNALYVGGDESSLCLLKGRADDAHSCGSLFVP